MKHWMKILLGANLSGWKRWLVQAVVILVVLGAGGIVAAVSGIVPIKASAGHWAITEWFLQFSKRRSVATHSLGIKPPPLDDPAMVLKGAGYFHVGCFPCHGSPDLKHPRIGRAMLPPPPYLPDRVPDWETEELFHIVKHGLKFTGMPAWVSQQRDDEVWAMVAFLVKFPEMTAEEYKNLALGSVRPAETAPLQELGEPGAIPSSVRDSCAPCHGLDGDGRGRGAYPMLAGQTVEYLEDSLMAYAAGERQSGIMQPIAAGLSAEKMREIAEYYHKRGGSQSPGQERRPEGPEGNIEQGKKIALEGLPDARVPACVHCHGPKERSRNPHYPQLEGQYQDYLILQLELFQKQHRGGTEFAHLMHEVAPKLTPTQIRDVTAYYSSLPRPIQEKD